MTYEFLSRLYYACTDDTAGAPPFAEVYEHIPEAKLADEVFGMRLERFPACDRDELNGLGIHLCLCYEKQGFINGFRLGMMLSRELNSER